MTAAKARAKYRCGFCSTGHHDRCRVSFYSPITGASLDCRCAADDEAAHPPPRCRICRYAASEDEPLSVQGMCLDGAMCELRLRDHLDASPLIQMLRECRTVDAVLVEQEGEIVTKTKTRERRAAPGTPKSGSCLCCGEPTKGGLFLPGHDARFVSYLATQVLRGDTMTYEAAMQRLAPCSDALRAKFAKRHAAAVAG